MARQAIKTVAEVKEYAQSKYNEGGDIVIECWSDSDIEEFIANCGRRSVRNKLDELFDTHNDRMADTSYYMGLEAEASDDSEAEVEVEVEEVVEEHTTDGEVEQTMAVRANRVAVTSTDNGYEARFYRTHRQVGMVMSADTDWIADTDANSTTNRESFRQWICDHSEAYGITWNPEKSEQAWERKYNTYMTAEQIEEDVLTLVTPTFDRLADKSRYDMVISGIAMVAVSAKDSNLSYVENGRYTKSGAWCVADIELELDIVIGNHSVEQRCNHTMKVPFVIEMKSGQICKAKLTIAQWNELIANELELNGITITNEEQTA